MITGIHHITALAGDPQQNINFYSGILGLRFIKKTVNFDAPDVYHLYYGDEVGNPGSVLTFFPFKNIKRGRKGAGMVNVTGFSINENSMGFWQDRLKKFKIQHNKPVERFNETALYFEDYDGMGIELVANNNDKRAGYETPGVTVEHAIKGFYNAVLWEFDPEKTAGLLTGLMNHKLISENNNVLRLAPDNAPGKYIDINARNEAGIQGGGSVHHIAFRTPDDDSQEVVRQKLLKENYYVTDVQDRNYFHSIYFREPGNVLFEVATDVPGFLIDESKEELGSSLKLPEWYEKDRKIIEAGLQPVNVNLSEYV